MDGSAGTQPGPGSFDVGPVRGQCGFAQISRDLRAELTATQWIISAYALMLGVLPVAMGRLGDILGRRRVYAMGLLGFVLASLGCGLAWGIGPLIAFRAVQGAAGAAMMSLALALVSATFPPQQRALAIGVWGGVSGLGLIAGPLLGGLLVQWVDWRWIFLINIPPGLLALGLTRWIVMESRDQSAPRQVDWLGAALLTIGLLLLMLALSQSRAAGWVTVRVLGPLAASALVLLAFLATERRTRHPLIQPGLFRNRTFLAAAVSTLAFSAAVFGSQPFTSLFMQNTWGFSPLLAGLAFLPAVVLVAAFLPISGWLGKKLGGRLHWAVTAGGLAVLASTAFLLPMDRESGYATSLLPALLLRGVGIGMFISSSMFAAMAALPVDKAGLASGVLTMARQVGTALGVALLGTVYLDFLDIALPSLTGQGNATLAALEKFSPFGEAALRVATEDIAVAGFVRIAWATGILCAAAALAAWFIRHRPLKDAQASRPRRGPLPTGTRGELTAASSAARARFHAGGNLE